MTHSTPLRRRHLALVLLALLLSTRALAEGGEAASQQGAPAEAKAPAEAPAAQATAPAQPAAAEGTPPAAPPPEAAVPVAAPAAPAVAPDGAEPVKGPTEPAAEAAAQPKGEPAPASTEAAAQPKVEPTPATAEPAKGSAEPAPAVADAKGAPLPAPPELGLADPAWYQPGKGRIPDAELPWNSSILGAFDPWTSAKITLLGTLEPLAFTVEKGNGLVAFDQPDGSTSTMEYASVQGSGTFMGARFEWGDWSATYATGTTELVLGNELGGGATLSGSAMQVTIATGFGAWAIHDFGSPDVRIGISWPELQARTTLFGSTYSDAAAGIDQADFIATTLACSFLGLRVTVGDLLFAELRAGRMDATVLYTKVQYAPANPGESAQTDHVVQLGFTERPVWTPSFRLGIAL